MYIIFCIFFMDDWSFGLCRFVEVLSGIFFERLEEIFLIAKFKNLIIRHSIFNNTLPGWIYAESFNISEYYAKIFCSWKTDINSSKITNKSYCFSLILFEFFIAHDVPWTNCAEYYDIFLSTLEGVDCFYFTFFVFTHEGLKIRDLLAVRWNYADIFVTSW